MKIAVTYEDGNVFQHFGRTENFKVYDVEDGKVVSAEVMGSDGVGHEALAWLLKDSGIDALICGGMGQGAQDALAEAGIEVCAGASGDADAAVEAFLRGELVNTGVNCDHHDHEHGHDHGHDHDHGEEGCTPEMCAGCAGGCGGGMPDLSQFYMFEGTNVGKRVKVHYKGTFDDGTQFDSSYDRGTPLDFICGVGQMIKGFDRACAEMKVGDIIDVHLEPEDAYGLHNPDMVITVQKATIQGLEGIEVGDKVMLQDELGRPFDAFVTFMDDENITFDCNHEMVDKALNFTIEMLEII
ncbi:MAG: FKBP-type peptidyl-prolyl cis-trans isomerase [Mogibacterium sp.]|nr:FKBP-type peptidyl-prolyl cis-trans isomerase [Mogibacterium sp.]